MFALQQVCQHSLKAELNPLENCCDFFAFMYTCRNRHIHKLLYLFLHLISVLLFFFCYLSILSLRQRSISCCSVIVCCLYKLVEMLSCCFSDIMLLRSPSNYISRCSFLLPQKVQLIPTVRLVRVKENFFCYSIKRDLSSSVSKRSAHSSSVPAGLIDLASQQLDQQQSNGLDFNARTELQNCVEQLKDCLQDERDLQNLVDDPDTEPEMLALARTDLASLADKVSQLVEQIKLAMIPKASYDSEDALIEVFKKGLD